MTKVFDNEKTDAFARLHAWIKPGDTVYTILRHVSASGTSRVIDVLVIVDGIVRHLSYSVGLVTGYKEHTKKEGLKISGGGMDMGFEMVYTLGRAMFPDGVGLPCRAATHMTHRKATKDEPDRMVHGASTCVFHGRNGDPSGWEPDGGYAFRQEWL